jgi:hypothetical protein
MSVKLDTDGNPIGSYEIHELETVMWPPEKKKNKRRLKLRKLEYDLIWDITEMQVKIHVRPVFPNPTGPLTMQLAKERPIPNDEITGGESRSYALVRDIEISTAASRVHQNHGNAQVAEEHVEEELVNDPSLEPHQQPRAETTRMIRSPSVSQPTGRIFSQGQLPLPERRAEPIVTTASSATVPQSDTKNLDDSVSVITLQIKIQHGSLMSQTPRSQPEARRNLMD